MACIICCKPTQGKGKRICSEECREKLNENKRLKRIAENRIKDEQKYEGLEEGKDFIVCKWCGTKTSRIYGAHIKNFHHGKTSDDYKADFPGEPLCCSSDKEATSKNAGQHMKTEKYRTLFSNMNKGENNPMHHSKTTEQQRKENSPFSKEFYIKRGATLEEAEQKVHDFAKEALADRVTTTNIEYYINHGMSEEEAKEALKERQRTFTLEKCIEKYGEEEGTQVWRDRQARWKSKVYNSDTCISQGHSIAALKLCELVSELVPKVRFGRDEKVIYDKDLSRCYKYDMALNKKLIEFNGNYWHCNPKIYDANYFNPSKQMFASEIWEYDARKKQVAEDYGYEVLTVWEDDFIVNPEDTIKNV